MESRTYKSNRYSCDRILYLDASESCRGYLLTCRSLRLELPNKIASIWYALNDPKYSDEDFPRKSLYSLSDKDKKISL